MSRIPVANAPVLAEQGPGATWLFWLALVIVVLAIGTVFWWWGRRRRRPQDPT